MKYSLKYSVLAFFLCKITVFHFFKFKFRKLFVLSIIYNTFQDQGPDFDLATEVQKLIDTLAEETAEEERQKALEEERSEFFCFCFCCFLRP